MESSTADTEYTEDNIFSSAVDSENEVSVRSNKSDDENDIFDAATYDDNYEKESSDSSYESDEEGYGDVVFKEEIKRKHEFKKKAHTDELEFESDSESIKDDKIDTRNAAQNENVLLNSNEQENLEASEKEESEVPLMKKNISKVSPPPLQLPAAEEWYSLYLDGKVEVEANSGKNSEKYMVVLEIVRCKNLRNSDTSSKSDPFVSIRFPDMDKFERQLIFTTRRTNVIQNNLNPAFNEVFRFPIHEEDIKLINEHYKKGDAQRGIIQNEETKLAEAGVSLVQPRPLSDMAFDRFGIHISVLDHDSSGDHDLLGKSIIYFSQLRNKPSENSESDPARHELDLSGEGALENSTIVVRGWLQPPLSALKEIHKNKILEKKIQDEKIQQEIDEKNEAISEKEEDILGKSKEARLAAIEKAMNREGQYSRVGMDDKDIETVKLMVSKITSTRQYEKNEEFDRDGIKFRAYLSLARLARTTKALRTLIGQLMLGSGISMAMSDLAHKTARLRQASASLLLSLVHSNHLGNTRILKSHSGFQINDVHVFWIPESLRDAYLDAGSRRKAEDSQREKDGRRKRKPVSWWPPSEKGFVTFLKEKLKRSLSVASLNISAEKVCDHSYEGTPLRVICFPPAPVFKKRKGKGNGMAWFLSELLEQSQTGSMFSVLRKNDVLTEENLEAKDEHKDKDEQITSCYPTVVRFEQVLDQYKLMEGIDKVDFERFVSIFTQVDKNGEKVLNLDEMERALLPPDDSFENENGIKKTLILDRVIPFLKNFVNENANFPSDENLKNARGEIPTVTERGIDHIYRLSDKNNDGTINIQELLSVLSTLINGGIGFEPEETQSLLSFFDRNGTGFIERNDFERFLTEWRVEGNVSIMRNDKSIFNRLAAVEDADEDGQIVDWIPDPENFLLGFRLPQQLPEENAQLSPQSKAMRKGVNVGDHSADAKEIADITRLRKIYESLDKDHIGIVSCNALKADKVFVELIGKKGALKIISHFQAEKGAIVNKNGEVCVSWDELVEYRRYLNYKEMVAFQQREAELLKTKPVHLFSTRPKFIHSKDGKNIKLDGLPRFRENLLGNSSASIVENIGKLPRTRVLIKVYGEPARQKIRFDCVLRPSDGSMYRARIPISKVLPLKDSYDVSEMLTIEKKTVKPFLDLLMLPSHHIHAGDNTKLRSSVSASLEAWVRENEYILMHQVKKGRGMALLKKETEPDEIALKGLQVGLELFKQKRKVEVWRLLEQTVHLIIKSCPVSANRSILVTRALDTLISQYKTAKSMSEGVERRTSKSDEISEQEKALFMLRDSVRNFRKTYVTATVNMNSKRQKQFRRTQVVQTPSLQNRRAEQQKKDKASLRRIVEENRRRAEKKKARRLEEIQHQNAVREARLKDHNERIAAQDKERKRSDFIRKQKSRIEARKLEIAKAKEERQWMLQKRRLDAKRLALEKLEKKKAEELRDRKAKEAKQEVIKRQQAFLLAKAEKSSRGKQNYVSRESHKENKKPSEIQTHQRLLKFGENIAAQRKQSKSTYMPKNKRYDVSEENKFLTEIDDTVESEDDMIVSEM